MPEKTFLLGVGAQKSGTSWLRAYLNHNANVDMGQLKEYHVWDSVYLGIDPQKAPSPRTQTPLARARAAFMARIGKPDKARIRREFRKDSEAYFSYFQARLRRRIEVTGDFTPSYAGLPREAYDFIKSGFASRNIKVRVMFIMRDPVERLFSAVRMYKRAGRGDLINLTADDETNLRALSETSHARLRGEYHKTIETLKQVFAPEDIYLGLYETMFAPESLTDLAAFTGLPARKGFTEKKVNTGGQKQALSAEAIADVQAQFAEVYRYCHQHFPETRTLWHPF